MKRVILTIVTATFSMLLFANPVSKKDAELIAINYYKHRASTAITDYSLSRVVENQYQGTLTYYVFVFKSGGFVMVSADDASVPVLGYSTESQFDENNIPSNAKGWFESYSKEIKYIVDEKISNSETLFEWQRIANESFNENARVIVVNPLCVTTWGQDAPYNLLCPSSSKTGCPATAMAQVMKKWNYPTTGQGSHSYVHQTYGTLSVNFGTTTYQWANMLNNYPGGSTSAQNNAVATLMYHCGVSDDINYSPSGTSGNVNVVKSALINYFRYQPNAELKIKTDFSNNDWITLLKEELDAGRPMIYAGTDASASGHVFVCDGYDASDKFHFNWGWTGSSNGYYTMGNLNPATYHFDLNNHVVVRIRPLSNIIPIAHFYASTITPAIGAPVTFTDLSYNNPNSWQWTFKEGTPSSYSGQTPPTVTFSTSGYHLVSLKVSNTNGSDIKTMEQYINVGGSPSMWIKQNTGFSMAVRGINQIFIVNPNVVWAKAYDRNNPDLIREFTRTTNGGITWTPGTINFTNASSYSVPNIFAFSATDAYACMSLISGTGGKIVKTTDGGVTWTEQTTALFTGSNANFVRFFNVNEGVCMGNPVNNQFVIYTTTNGGTTWTQVPGANIPNAQSSEIGCVHDAVGDIIWFSTTQGRIYKSVNKGLNWTVASTGLTNRASVVFKDANVGFAILGVSPYTMKKTNDGGSTWNTFTPTGSLVNYPYLDYVPGTASTWVNVGAYPDKGSSYSTDDCASFINIDKGTYIEYTRVSFYDTNTGWAGAYNENATDGGIYKWNTSIFTGLNDIKQSVESFVRIYPNPNNGSFTIQVNAATKENINIRVFDLLGKNVYEENNINFNKQLTKQITLDYLRDGIYFVGLTGNNISYFTKIIIQQ